MISLNLFTDSFCLFFLFIIHYIMSSIPKRIFIVPYRNRLEQKFFFSKQMSFILEDCDDYEIYFSHQCDSRQFNRGATKNIGFLAMKEKYPHHYKEITFIFNDVDTLPFHKLFDYQTVKGVVKHYYGFDFCLGGITAIRGSDFEKINGFPSFWYWGWEDTVIYERAKAANIKINRDNFYRFGDASILHLMDGVQKTYSINMYEKYKNQSITDGLSTLKNVRYEFNELLDISHFDCGRFFMEYDT